MQYMFKKIHWVFRVIVIKKFTNEKDKRTWHLILWPQTSSWISELAYNLHWVWRTYLTWTLMAMKDNTFYHMKKITTNYIDGHCLIFSSCHNGWLWYNDHRGISHKSERLFSLCESWQDQTQRDSFWYKQSYPSSLECFADCGTFN